MFPGNPGAGAFRPTPSPVVTALDLNGDGIIDAGELAKASVSLKKLDANTDGKLTSDELHPPRLGSPDAPGGLRPGAGRPQ
jgi:hypothetical protein